MRQSMANVIVLIGAGQTWQAIARRVGVGKHVVLADMRPDNANAAAVAMSNAGYDVRVATVDVSCRPFAALVRWRSCCPGCPPAAS